MPFQCRIALLLPNYTNISSYLSSHLSLSTKDISEENINIFTSKSENRGKKYSKYIFSRSTIHFISVTQNILYARSAIQKN